MSNTIQHEYTDLQIPRQQKWNLRNRDKLAEYQHRYKTSDKGRAANKRYYQSRKAVDKSTSVSDN